MQQGGHGRNGNGCRYLPASFRCDSLFAVDKSGRLVSCRLMRTWTLLSEMQWVTVNHEPGSYPF